MIFRDFPSSTLATFQTKSIRSSDSQKGILRIDSGVLVHEVGKRITTG